MFYTSGLACLGSWLETTLASTRKFQSVVIVVAVGKSNCRSSIAVQHQHYVASEGGDHWLIYRREDSSCAPAFEIKPEHAWLLRAVAVNLNGDEDPVLGTVEDGVLTAHNDPSRIVYVDDEMDDWTAVHEYCWEASGHELLPTAPQLLAVHLSDRRKGGLRDAVLQGS